MRSWCVLWKTGCGRSAASCAPIARRSLLRLANVQHLYTEIRGALDGPATALDVALRLHPTPAVGGVPRERAQAVVCGARSPSTVAGSADRWAGWTPAETGSSSSRFGRR